MDNTMFSLLTMNPQPLQPTEEEIAWSLRVVAAFAGNPSGVVKMDGKMLDKPHLRAAEKILALRGR
jgi:citrate lyase subunit beta/citryl-CoA lyase